MRLNDSGVVISAVGKRRSCLARSEAGVSPVRMPTVQPRPSSSTGALIARPESAASARIGVSQRTPSAGAIAAFAAPAFGRAFAAPAFGRAAAAPSAAARAIAPNHTA